MNTAQVFYQQKAEEYSIHLKKLTGQLRWFGWFRFVAFLLIPAPAFLFGLKSPVTFFVGAAALVLFLFLIKKNIQFEKRKRETNILKKLCDDELLALKHQFAHFKSGNEYIDPDHFYAYDLDLFGDGSLFQYLNRTVTVDGEKLLAKTLIQPPFEKEEITDRQKAIQELARNPEWRLHFRSTGLMFEESKALNHEIRLWSEKTINLEKFTLIGKLLWIVPLLTSGAAIPAVLGISNFFLWIAVLIQWILLVIFSKQVAFYFRYFGRKSALLEKYMALLELIGKTNFEAAKLTRLQKMVVEPKSAGKVFLALKNLVVLKKQDKIYPFTSFLIL